MDFIPRQALLEFWNGKNTCHIGFVISSIDIPYFYIDFLIKSRGKTILSLLNLIWIVYFTKPYTEHITSQN